MRKTVTHTSLFCPWQTHIMDGSQTLKGTLSDNLNAACFAIGEALTDGGRDLTLAMVERDIPDAVFTLAIYAQWISEPVAPVGSELEQLGYYTVEKRYRDDFISLIAQSLFDLREIADDGTEPLPTVMPVWSESYKRSLVPETTTEQRQHLVEQYLEKYKHPFYEDDYKMWELHWMANVRREVFDRWRREEISNNSKPGKRILALLERNKPHKNPARLRPRDKGEKLTF